MVINAEEADGEEKAKTVLSANKVDLVIMDMLLSGADGTDICRRMKRGMSRLHLFRSSCSPHIQMRKRPACRQVQMIL